MGTPDVHTHPHLTCSAHPFTSPLQYTHILHLTCSALYRFFNCWFSLFFRYCFTVKYENPFDIHMKNHFLNILASYYDFLMYLTLEMLKNLNLRFKSFKKRELLWSWCLLEILRNLS